jgi:hypothetical protein
MQQKQAMDNRAAGSGRSNQPSWEVAKQGGGWQQELLRAEANNWRQKWLVAKASTIV